MGLGVLPERVCDMKGFCLTSLSLSLSLLLDPCPSLAFLPLLLLPPLLDLSTEVLADPPPEPGFLAGGDFFFLSLLQSGFKIQFSKLKF